MQRKIADDYAVGFEYDFNGNKTQVSDPNGNVVNYEYNELNRMTNIIAEDATGDKEFTNTMQTE